MIIIMKPGAPEEAIQRVAHEIENKGLQVHLSHGHQVTIIGVVGDKSKLQGVNFEVSEGVDKVMSVTESYKLANRKFHPEDTIVTLGNTTIGPGTLTIMAGPCAIESRKQPLPLKRPALPCCVAALTSQEPPPIPSRVWRKKASAI